MMEEKGALAPAGRVGAPAGSRCLLADKCRAKEVPVSAGYSGSEKAANFLLLVLEVGLVPDRRGV